MIISEEMRDLMKRNSLEKAAEEYNRQHGTEAHIEVLKQYKKDKSQLHVRFTGPFCLSCAPDEYYADFQILLEEKTGLKFKIKSIKQENNGATVDFEYVEGKPAVVYISHF